VTHRPPIRRRRLTSLAGAVVLAVGVSACGHKVNHPLAGEPDGSAASGFYVDSGRITYQVEVSRELNPYATEDKAYLAGICDASLTPSQEWFAVFLWATNQSKVAVTTSDNITISDSQRNVYRPVPFSCGANPIAWTPTHLRPQQSVPLADSPAYYDLAQGAELLFKVNDSVYGNRPLVLNIYGAGQGRPAQVELDL
jgi:hypothetical protein